MKLRFTIQPEAAEEASDAFTWYETQQTGLGGEFYRELVRCFEFILENPLLPRVVYRELRKRKLERFPYFVIYRVSDDALEIVSVFHGSRNPKIWRERKQ